MTTPYTSTATGEIANNTPLPNDGDNADAASVDVPLELTMDDVKRLRVRASFDEATTFVEPGDGLGFVATSGNVGGEFSCAGWQLDRRILHANNDAFIRRSFDGGYTWSTEFTNGGSTFLGLASQTDSSAAIETAVGAHVAVTGPGNAWNRVSISSAGAVTPSCIVADPFNASTYWVGGLDNGSPKVWKMVTVNGAVPTQTQIALTGGAAGANVVAAGRNNVLAASNDAGTSRLWSISGGVGTAQTPPSATFIVDIHWLDAFGYFLLVASDGASTLELWTSPTGATGTWTALSSTYLVSLELGSFVVNGFLRGSCVVGPLSGGVGAPCLFMLPITLSASTTGAILVTADGGTTWKTLPDPLARHQSLSPVPQFRRLRVVNNRVIASAYSSAGKVYHALSARGGIPL